MASLSASGLAWMSAAMAGSDVEITVESMFSMNSATATINGIRRSRGMEMEDPARRGGASRTALIKAVRAAKSSVLRAWPGRQMQTAPGVPAPLR